MADNASMYGFRFHSTRSGSGTPNVVKKPVASAYDSGNSTHIWPGDVVKILDTGYVALAAAGDTGLFGVVVGIAPYYDGSKMVIGNRLPNITTYGTNYERQSFVHVIPFNDAVFEVDCDEAATYTTYASYLAAVGSNGDLVVSADATSGKSNMRLDISDVSAKDTAGNLSAQFRVVGISDTVENKDFSGNYVKLLVVANEAELAGYATGAVGL